MFVSLTRLRLRSWWYFPPFFYGNEKSVKQLRKAPGFRTGYELADKDRTFWTLTLWESQSAMKAFRSSGAHAKVMPKLAAWCDEAAVAHWEADVLPTWAEAHSRLVASGRSYPVNHPSARQANRSYPSPESRTSRPLNPA